jgi:tRNA-splicing ligase RtcB
MPEVARAIPAGVGEGHAEVQNRAYKWFADNKDRFTTDLTPRQNETLLSQLGSLGSGNHFFELCLDERDVVWIVLHSGSRGIGNQLGMKHIKSAKELMDQKHIKLEERDLAYFEENEDGFNLYIGDMLTCQDYARMNRDIMLDRALAAFRKFLDVPAREVGRINCHHNFTQKELQPEGKDLWITRKGAIKAGVGDLGIIPGSMGTRSYIVRGLGNPLSFNSCSHGAGRVHSRKAAKEHFSIEDLEKAMDGKVWNSDKAGSLVDEIPGAYKPVEQVMKDQEDLVETVHTLSQILNYKGAK